MRILYVAARYPPYIGGTEIHTAEVARRMCERGHQVTVLTTDATGSSLREEVRDGIRVLTVKSWPRDRDFHVAPGLRSVIAGETFDLMHVQGYHTAVAPLAMWAGIRSDRPFVVTFHSGGHSSRVRRLVRPVQRRAMRPLLRRAARLIGVSRFETDLFSRSLELPPERFATIPNGTSFDPATARGAAHGGGTVLVSVGRLERYKGHGRVIAALPELRRRLPDVRYLVIGTGPHRETLLRQAQRAGVADIVEIRSIPTSRREELASLVAGASVFLLLSDYESQGMAALEALALDVPVLVAAGSALTELTDHPNVWAVPAHTSPHELCDAVVDVLRAPRTTGGTSPALPRWGDIVDHLEALYERVLEEDR